MKHINYLSPNHNPVLHVSLGRVFEISTINSFGNIINSMTKFENILKKIPKKHPVAGPIFVERVNRGDAIAVKIEKITLKGNYFQCVSFSTGIIPGFSQNRNPKIYAGGKMIKIAGNKLEIQPNIGFIATTPKIDFSTGRTGKHGGNFDFPFIKEGAIIHLPCFLKGALFTIGDVHALQGEGEISGTGAETDALLKLSIHRSSFRKKYPLIEDANNYYICGWGRSILSALKRATKNALNFLDKNNKMETADNYLLLGLIGKTKLGNSTGWVKTAAIKVNKKYVSS